MKAPKIIIAVVLALCLVLGVTLPVLAASDEPAPQSDDLQNSDISPDLIRLPHKLITGSVIDVDGDDGESFFVIESRGRELKIWVTDNTNYLKLPIPQRFTGLLQTQMRPIQAEVKRPDLSLMSVEVQEQVPERLMQLKTRAKIAEPSLRAEGMETLKRLRRYLLLLRPFCEEAYFDEIAIGDKVMVQVVLEGEGITARPVLIIQPTAYQRVRGIISHVSSDIISITPADGGDTVTLTHNENTFFTLKGAIKVEEGQSAVVFYNEALVAKVVLIHIEAGE